MRDKIIRVAPLMAVLTLLALLGYALSPREALRPPTSPAVEAPAVEAPAVEAPAVEAPAVEATWVDAAKVALRLKGPGGVGSAVPISCRKLDGRDLWEVLALTCRHVVEDEDLLAVKVSIGEDGTIATPDLVDVHPFEDAALIRFVLPYPMHVVPLRVEHPPLGERVWAIGYPMGMSRTITDGYVGDHNKASADVFPGNSGGAVVDSQGRLVGIVDSVGVASNGFIRNVVSHVMFFISTEELKDWLDSHL